MSVRNVALVLAALLITAGTGILARSWIESQRSQVTVAPTPAAPPKVEGVSVLVATTDIPIGTFVKDTHLRWQSWPSEAVHESYIVRPKTEAAGDPIATLGLVGAVVRRAISAGEPVTKGRIVRPGDRGFLAAVLRPGYRAMAIKVTATSSIAGLVFPGDRVDLILTHTVKRGGLDRRASETVLTNVRVLAIDQTVDDRPDDPKVGKNATLELTPKQAEMLAVVDEIGKVSLSLRSLAKDEEELELLANSQEPLAEPDPTRGVTYTWDTEVSRLIWRPSSVNQDVVDVSRGNETQQLKFPKSK